LYGRYSIYYSASTSAIRKKSVLGRRGTIGSRGKRDERYNGPAFFDMKIWGNLNLKMVTKLKLFFNSSEDGEKV
jgi:hypothetical protein